MSEHQKHNFVIDIKRFKKGKRVNKESFVYSVQEKETGELFAAKIINCGDEEEQCQKIVTNEISVIFSLSHPTIIKYIGYSLKDFQDEYNITIIMQFAKNGSLDTVLKKTQKSQIPQNYTNTERQIILIGVSKAMQYLHEHNIVNGNLKSGNVLLDDKYHPLLTNFFQKSSNINHSKSQIQYLAPEIIKGAPCSTQTDVYAFSILMFEVFTDSVPYESLHQNEITDFEFRNQLINDDLRPTFKTDIKQTIRDLIEKCWSKNSAERSTFKEISEMLSNKDYFLDDVNEGEVKKYVEIISEFEVEKVIKNNEILKKENNQLKSENKKLKGENNSLKKKINELTKEIETLKKANKNSSPKITSQKAELSQLPPLFQKKETNNKNTEEITIKDFNEHTLQGQKKIISNLVSKKKDAFHPILNELNNLLHYLCKISPTKNYKFLEILVRNKEKYISDVTEKTMIQIHTNSAENLLKNNLFNSTEFSNCLKKFERFSFEIVHPSEQFDNMCIQISQLKYRLTDMFIEIVFNCFSIDKKNANFIMNDKVDCIVLCNSITSIKEYTFTRFTSLKQITIPSSITEFGDGSFNECYSLKIIEIPPSVVTIGRYAFQNCSSLEKISIPSSVTKIGRYAFKDCSSLTKVSISSSSSSLIEIENNIFEGCSSLKKFEIPSSVTIIKCNAFEGCSKLTKIKIPSSVTKIESSAFVGCSSMKQIEIPSSVTEIENDVFKECFSLVQIKIPFSVIKIRSRAFQRCSSLKNIEIPSSVVEIGNYVFEGCVSLKQITIPSSITKLNGSILSGCKNVDEIIFSSNYNEMKYKFFENQFIIQKSNLDKDFDILFWVKPNVDKINIPPFIKEIGDYSFDGLSSLTEIEIHSEVVKIGEYAFCRCSSLVEIEIPSSVTNIGKGTFSQCSSLTRIIIPSSIKSIGAEVFDRCSSLIEIKIPSSVTEICYDAFYGCSLIAEITIPSSVTEIGCSAFKKCSSLIQINLPSSVIKIGSNAFEGCSSLTQINIPSSLTEINGCLFKGCTSLAQINIPSSVTRIGYDAFEGCLSLTQITIPSSVNIIESGVFAKCKNLYEISILQSDEMLFNFYENKFLLQKSISSNIYDVFLWVNPTIDSIVIPSFIKEIANSAFKGCTALKSVTIPSSVTKIGDYAFYKCSSLEQIEIPSSVTEIGPDSFAKCSYSFKLIRK